MASGYVVVGTELRKDPDEQVRQAIAEVFAKFHETGSARQTVRKLREAGTKLPGKRGNREMEWSEATYARVYQVLTNPLMGGAYVYQRQRTELRVDGRGEVSKKVLRLPRQEWTVVLEKHHEGYVEWHEWLEIQERMAENSLRVGSGAPREGRALLQRLVACGVCGRRMQVLYGSGVRYVCLASQSGTGKRGCQSVGGAQLERWVSERFLEAAGMGGVEAALRAERQAEEREARRLRSYELELERCAYAAQLAERRYKAEDPENRLVTRTLARDWEAALREVERAQRELEQAAEREPRRDPEVSGEVFAQLGARVRSLWESPRVSARDRKRLLAALVEEVVLKVERAAGHLHVLLRWRGGWIDETDLPLPARVTPPPIQDDPATVEIVRGLALLHADERIAETLNRQGLRSARGMEFSRGIVASLRQRHGIKLLRGGKRQAEAPPQSVSEAARELGTTASTLYRWIQQGFVPAEAAVEGAALQVRLSPAVRARFCESPPEGYVRAKQARRELGLSRQALWQRIREGALDAKRIVRGTHKGLYVKRDWDRQRLLDWGAGT